MTREKRDHRACQDRLRGKEDVREREEGARHLLQGRKEGTSSTGNRSARREGKERLARESLPPARKRGPSFVFMMEEGKDAIRGDRGGGSSINNVVLGNSPQEMIGSRIRKVRDSEKGSHGGEEYLRNVSISRAERIQTK